MTQPLPSSGLRPRSPRHVVLEITIHPGKATEWQAEMVLKAPSANQAVTDALEHLTAAGFQLAEIRVEAAYVCCCGHPPALIETKVPSHSGSSIEPDRSPDSDEQKLVSVAGTPTEVLVALWACVAQQTGREDLWLGEVEREALRHGWKKRAFRRLFKDATFGLASPLDRWVSGGWGLNRSGHAIVATLRERTSLPGSTEATNRDPAGV